jgi:hypothetical protein
MYGLVALRTVLRRVVYREGEISSSLLIHVCVSCSDAFFSSRRVTEQSCKLMLAHSPLSYVAPCRTAVTGTSGRRGWPLAYAMFGETNGFPT